MLLAFRDQHGLDGRLQINGYSCQVWDVLKTASMFVSISKFEGTPNIVLEAAAVGCPLLLSDIAPHRELLDEDAAMFVPYDSPDKVAEGMMSILGNRHAAQKRAVRAHMQIAGWSTASIAAEYLTLYNKVIESLGPA